MATKDDRTLGAGISFPQWMKSKKSYNFDLDQNTFSPPELDDTFMVYYRQPKVKESDSSTTATTTIIKANLPEKITVASVANTKKADFSQHPVSCQKFLQNGQGVEPRPQTTAEMKIKSAGIDDGFKGEAAKCGSSIIKVASQMVSSQGLGIRCDQPPILEEKYDRRRRGSRSLPASPLVSPHTSPKANRKMNKYFTGAFTDVDKSKGSWILSNLLARREISQSVGQIKEELAEELNRTASASNMSVDDFGSSAAQKPPVFKAKPSELREMNFWSPTSM